MVWLLRFGVAPLKNKDLGLTNYLVKPTLIAYDREVTRL